MKGKETFRVYPGTPFCDIEACPHREAIARCYSRGWFLRMAATRFGPDRPLERAMLAAVLHRVAGCPSRPGGACSSTSSLAPTAPRPRIGAPARGFCPAWARAGSSPAGR